MKPTRKLLARPDLGLIASAIKNLEKGYDTYSCLALGRAIEQRFKRSDTRHALYMQYTSQYRQSCAVNGRLPNWWNHPYVGYQAERIAALRNFANLCKKAAK